MGISMKTGTNLDDYLENQIKARLNKVVETLDYVGTTCVSEAKTNGSYTDRTGNLRSSIGYVVVNDGATVRSGGCQRGPEFLEELAAKFPRGIVLIVAAGENYAAELEARSFNVLISAELLAEQMIPGLLKQLGFTRR